MGQGKRQFGRKLALLGALLCTLFAANTARTLFAADKQADDDEEAVEAKPTKKIVEKNLTLSTGVSRTVEFQFDVGPINLTDPSLFEFRRLREGEHERKILFIPKNPGYTDMTIHDSQGAPRVTYYVRVTREDVGNVISQLEELLGDIEGIKIKAVGGTIFIDGDILLPKDMIRIMRVVDAMKDRDPKKKEIPIRNTASISKITMNIIAERIEREVNSPEISARVLNNNILLEGTADGDFEADRAVEIAKTYLPEAFVEKGKGEGGEIKPKQAGGVGGGVPTIIDFLRVRPRQAPPPSQDIKITVNYVELNNDYQKAFNFEWKPLYQDGSNVKYDSTVGQITASLIATVSSLFPKLSTAKDHGHARILKQEQIIVKDRAEQPSSIESSITMYIRNVDERGVASLQAIPVQNFVKVRAATIQGSDSLELGIQVQLTNLVGQNGGQPMVATNSIQTQVTIKNGDSAALGGYAVDNALASYNREPNSSTSGGRGGGGNQNNTTAIFDLQRSKSFNRTKQQYIIFVTPEILRTAAQATEDITRKFRLNAGER